MFWDSSAVVPLLVPERRSRAMATLLRRDEAPAVWWTISVECRSALQRRRREAGLPARAVEPALRRLEALLEDVDTVQPVEGVIQRAGRLLGAHPLHAADAIQLAAALLWCENAPEGERFVCLDDRLRKAAAAEGFALAPG
jgi:predicted nucleic acid-binding protein